MIVGRNGVVGIFYVSGLFDDLVGNYITSEIAFVIDHALGIGRFERS